MTNKRKARCYYCKRVLAKGTAAVTRVLRPGAMGNSDAYVCRKGEGHYAVKDAKASGVPPTSKDVGIHARGAL